MSHFSLKHIRKFTRNTKSHQFFDTAGWEHYESQLALSDNLYVVLGTLSGLGRIELMRSLAAILDGDRSGWKGVSFWVGRHLPDLCAQCERIMNTQHKKRTMSSYTLKKFVRCSFWAKANGQSEIESICHKLFSFVISYPEAFERPIIQSMLCHRQNSLAIMMYAVKENMPMQSVQQFIHEDYYRLFSEMIESRSAESCQSLQSLLLGDRFNAHEDLDLFDDYATFAIPIEFIALRSFCIQRGIPFELISGSEVLSSGLMNYHYEYIHDAEHDRVLAKFPQCRYFQILQGHVTAPESSMQT
ncbi:MAG: hypothetical protein ACRC8S_04075 [Fimbriiglobus sp.]